RSGRVRRCARSTNTRPSSTVTSKYSPGSPSGGPTCESRSRSASSSSRSAPISFASCSTVTPSGGFATYGTMNSRRRKRWATSRIAGLHVVTRAERIELGDDARAQALPARDANRALRGEHAHRGKLGVRAIERDQRAVPIVTLDGSRPEVLVRDLRSVGREGELHLLGRLARERPR